MHLLPGQSAAEISLAEVHEAIAASHPDDECLVFGDRRLSWADVTDRTRRLANHLIERGLGCHTERMDLADHESGQDHLAIYLHNGNEYLECMLGALKARVGSINVNYRYVAEELRYLFTNGSVRAVVVHSAFTPTLAEVLGDLPDLDVILQVPDDSGEPLLPGATWYEDALASASADRPAVDWNPDDLYLLYTGGTTGLPKGVMWRNGDAMRECFGGSKEADTVEEFVAAAQEGPRALLAPPFMHGAGHWVSFRTWLDGGTVVIQSIPERLDPVDVWGTVERERVAFLLIVGDAFARPLVDELDRVAGTAGAYDLSSLTVVLSGGAALSAPLKSALLGHLPTAMVIDGLGSSEAGGQVSHVSAGGEVSTGTFELTPGNAVLSADLDAVLEPCHDELGWLAKTGRLALGYLGDPEKTARTYPTVDGVRYAVPGDRARLRSDGTVELHGRDSVTINSGGEKIFAEEVEAAIKAHDAVHDCVVAGRPSERWGSEVVAVVRIRDGH
ncbi:MAG: AMP-binding protein, partial [Actinomycetota bacterium]